MSDAAEPKKKSGMLVKILIAVAVLGGVGGGAAWYLMRGAPASAEEQKPAVPLAERGLVPFEPFLVNLADEGGGRFLKANVQLVVESAEEAKHIEETPVISGHLRSAILELLTQQTAPVLVTPEGKDALKHAIKERTAAVLGEEKIVDVLFAEFVVQF